MECTGGGQRYASAYLWKPATERATLQISGFLLSDQNAKWRVRVSSSRSNSRSSNDAAIPNQPGMAAGSVRVTRALLTITTLPRPIGLLTKTTSNSIAVCAAKLRGQRKNTPEELMSRVTSVIGKS